MSQTSEHMIQGILVSGVAYYMQVWVIEKSGPVFLAMTMPITLLVTIVLSLFLGEAVTLGRCVCLLLASSSLIPSILFKQW
jgi:drug/metabolite transporter (DMT)-like permease